MGRISAVIAGRNRGDKLKKVVDSLRSCGEIDEIIYVDTGSSEEELKKINAQMENLEKVKIIKEVSTNPQNGRNLGADIAINEYILFIDDDALISGNCLGEALDFLDRHEVIGAMGFPTYYITNEGKELLCSYYLLTPFYTTRCVKNYEENNFISVMSMNNAYLARKRAFQDAGRWDEMFFIQYDETDLLLRFLRHGYKIAFYGKIHIIDLSYNESRGDSIIPEIGLTRNELGPRNSILSAFKNFSRLGLIFFLPLAFVGNFFYSIRVKKTKYFFKGLRAFFKLMPYIREYRKSQTYSFLNDLGLYARLQFARPFED